MLYCSFQIHCLVKCNNLMQYYIYRLLRYLMQNIQYRHYGHLLEKLITTTTQIKHQKQRREYINLTANHMKKSYLTWMRPNVENEQILNDLRQLSRGRIAPNPNEIALRNTKKLLAEIQGSPVSDTPKKKKKK